MKKLIKYFLGIISLFFVLLAFATFFPWWFRPGPGHMDAVMVDNEIYFVLEDEYKVRGIFVNISSATAYENIMWACRPAREDGYMKTGQLKFGQKIEEYKLTADPKELQKNISYIADIRTTRKTLHVTFTINGDNKITMTHRFHPTRPKNRTVVIERNGQKITVPYSVSFDKDGNKVTVSKPGLK